MKVTLRKEGGIENVLQSIARNPSMPHTIALEAHADLSALTGSADYVQGCTGG